MDFTFSLTDPFVYRHPQPAPALTAGADAERTEQSPQEACERSASGEEGTDDRPQTGDPHIANLRKSGFVSVGELLTREDTDPSWLVNGLLTAGGLSIVVAKPKVGKSVLVRNLAFAVACGDSFLDRPTQQGLVLYLAVEEKESEVKNHFQRLGASHLEDRLLIRFGYPSTDVFQELAPTRETTKPALLIIDTLFGAKTVKDENSYAQMTAALSPINALAWKTGTHVLLLVRSCPNSLFLRPLPHFSQEKVSSSPRSWREGANVSGF